MINRKTISMILICIGLAIAAIGAITPVCGAIELPVVTIYNTADIQRGQIGAFVVKREPAVGFSNLYVNFNVGGTAIKGVDFITPVSPVQVVESGFGAVIIQSLLRPTFNRQPLKVEVKLAPGPGYIVGEPNSAIILINNL